MTLSFQSHTLDSAQQHGATMLSRQAHYRDNTNLNTLYAVNLTCDNVDESGALLRPYSFMVKRHCGLCDRERKFTGFHADNYEIKLQCQACDFCVTILDDATIARAYDRDCRFKDGLLDVWTPEDEASLAYDYGVSEDDLDVLIWQSDYADLLAQGSYERVDYGRNGLLYDLMVESDVRHG